MKLSTGQVREILFVFLFSISATEGTDNVLATLYPLVCNIYWQHFMCNSNHPCLFLSEANVSNKTYKFLLSLLTGHFVMDNLPVTLIPRMGGCKAQRR